MKTAYFDCFAGASGDMILGALLDAGLDIEILNGELGKLNLPGVHIEAGRITKKGISVTKAEVAGAQQSHGHGRHLKEIVNLIAASALPEKVRENSIRIFQRLAEVEAQIHNTTPEKIHFHEVGAVDAICDIVGAAIGFYFLGIESVCVSPLPLGGGFVQCQHGLIPVPAPATLGLLKGVPVYSSHIREELVTPTGAAILSTLADSFGLVPPMKVDLTGYGAGSRELEIPNVLRLIIGETEKETAWDSLKIETFEEDI